MYNFRGKLDEKNRLTIPAEARAEFENQAVIITPGFKDYLHLYTEKTWESEMETALSNASTIGDGRPVIINEELADLNDRFLSELTSTKVDARGRITVDTHLLTLAGLDRNREYVAVRMPAGNSQYYWRIKAKAA